MPAALLGNGPALYPNFDAATWYELVIWGVCASAGIGCVALVVCSIGAFVAANAGQVRRMKENNRAPSDERPGSRPVQPERPFPPQPEPPKPPHISNPRPTTATRPR